MKALWTMQHCEGEPVIKVSRTFDPKWKGDFETPTDVFYKAWVAGGEAESDMFGLGFTYIPYFIWRRIYPQVKDINWDWLDDKISTECENIGQKALIEWDCIVNHAHYNAPDMKGRGRIDKSKLGLQ